MFRTARVQALGEKMLFGRKPFINKREETIPCPNLLPCQKDYCCCCSVAKSCTTICGPMDCSIPGFPVLHYVPEFAQIHIHQVSDAIYNHLILCCPLLLPSIFPSIRVFSSESALRIRWPKCWRLIGGWLFLRSCRYWSISENSAEAGFLRGRFVFREKKKNLHL